MDLCSTQYPTTEAAARAADEISTHEMELNPDNHQPNPDNNDHVYRVEEGQEETDRNDDGDVRGTISQAEEPPLPAIMDADDPRRMDLTIQERQWGLDIRNAVEGLPDLDNQSDFMYAQLALVVKDDFTEAVKRLYALQDFRAEYDISDTYQDGCQCLESTLRLLPEQFLNFAFSLQESTYVFIHDLAKHDAASLTTLKKENDWMKAMYYLHITFCPDMESIRKGILILVECAGVDYSNMKQGLNLSTKLFSKLMTIFPINGKTMLYHTGTITNVMASMLRQILPENLRSKFLTGIQLDGRLNTIFLVPDIETANTRIILRVEETFRRRLENERIFSLSADRESNT